MSSAPDSLLQLSAATTPVHEYLAKRSILQRNIPVTVLLEFTDWHCMAQCCSVLSNYVENEAEIKMWLVRNITTMSIACNRHCACQIFKLISLLESDSDVFVAYDALLSVCPKNRLCFVIPCLRILDASVNSAAPHQQLIKTMERLQNLSNILPQFADNFVGQIIPTGSRYSPQLRSYVLISLKIVASEQTDFAWKRQQLFNLNDMISNALRTDSISDLVRGLIEVFEDDDGKLILATKCMMDILLDLSDASAAHDLFNEFLKVIRYDHSVLVDWMTSDETSVEVLRLLMAYMKCEKSGMREPVRHLLLQVQSVVQRLTDAKMFPYNALPLLRRMRSL